MDVYKFDNKAKFDAVKSKLRIIARATAEDKKILISGIRQAGGLVAMSGDSISDAVALKMANVGLCMGSGCTVAKDNSDLVILDNDFISIHHAIMWGRIIFENVRKFIQFQLTINITLCVLILVAGATLGHSPLSVIQLLWVNLIMDTLGAIAICTEPYQKSKTSSTNTNRISRRDKIITVEMWRNILGQCAYQLFALFFLLYFSTLIFFEKPYNLVYAEDRDDDFNPTAKMQVCTMIFHTFVLMNLFNQINSRCVSPTELNVFKTLLNNPFFWMIFIFEMALQNYMIYAARYQLGSALLGTAPLTTAQLITCWCLGAFTLVVHVIMKQVPLEKFAWFEKNVDIETNNDDNPLLRVRNRAIDMGRRGTKLLEESFLKDLPADYAAQQAAGTGDDPQNAGIDEQSGESDQTSSHTSDDEDKSENRDSNENNDDGANDLGYSYHENANR